MDDALALLEREYCPPVDSALFSAIVSDFDITNDAGVTAARETLDAIKASALEQDSTDFDPSGQATHADDGSNGYLLRAEDLSSDPGTSLSEETDLTSVSNDAKSLAPKDGPDANSGYIAEVEKQDEASKFSTLKEMFPNSADFAISYTLKKCGGSWARTLEELLNHAFIDEQRGAGAEDMIHAKGIDAFSEDNIIRRGRRKKHRQSRTTDEDEPSTRSSSLPVSPSVSSWDKASKDINFLSLRVNTPSKTISSTYYRNGASLSATIIALAEAYSGQSAVASSDVSVQESAFALWNDFPAIDAKYLVGIISLTKPSTAAAHDLANVLSTSTSGNRGGGIELIPRYAPINVNDSDEIDGATTNQLPKSRSGTSTPKLLSGDPAALAQVYLQAQQRSFDQASAAYRRGKSDHLMSAAAAYYSQQGRDYAGKHSEATAQAADALVESQSTKDEIDLHGVSVKDAVRIAKQKTEEWWLQKRSRVMGLDGRVRDEANLIQPLRIVTGLGRHSAGGRAKIGPAVGKMLINMGWVVTVGDGVLTVYEKKR